MLSRYNDLLLRNNFTKPKKNKQIMKKLLFIAVVAVASLASCKKDYTCTCNYTYNGVADPTPDVTTIVGVSKSTAQAQCASFTGTETSGSNSFTVVGTCKLN